MPEFRMLSRSTFSRCAPLSTVLLLVLASPVTAGTGVTLPGAPGPATCIVDAGQAEVANDALRYRLTDRGQSLGRGELENRWTSRNEPLDGPLLRLTLTGADRKTLDSDDWHLVKAPTCETAPINPDAARLADRRHGADIHAVLESADGTLRLDYRLRLRDDSPYVRELYELHSNADLAVSKVQLLDVLAPGATVAGTASGSPVMATDHYFGVEHPMSEPIVVGGRANIIIRRVLPVRAGVAVQYSTVAGVTATDSPRRGFAAYLEAERAHPFRPFLHYNSWYDIGYFSRYTEQEALNVVARYGEELVKKRGVTLDSFLFDDGWDDPKRLWQFNDSFPQGFARLDTATAALGAGPGMWLSPWGGYGPPRAERLAAGRAGGYEVDDQGLALSGPHYYPLFHDTVLDLVRRYHVNQFKLDGTGSPDKVTEGSAFDSDFAAAMELIADLRRESPSLYINLTTGTWPSPFWLMSADSIWRGGDDHAFLGTGTDRQRWITYRDADTYGGIVRQGPWFPLNALMLHGIIYAKHARGLDVTSMDDFADEVWSYFATGTGLQELYVSPDLLGAAHWDLLAEAAQWARERADILRDSHWVGGDPAREAVYGWASWSSQASILALRNPASRPQIFTVDLPTLLEIPKGHTTRFQITRRHGPALEGTEPISAPRTVTLPPHTVLVWDLRPLPAKPATH
jgi:hypothetical protein